MKCIDCSKHGRVYCAVGETILKSELVCQASGDKPVVTGASKAVMAATEAPAWCPLKKVTNASS